VRIIATILIAVGLIALIYGGFSYRQDDTIVDAGPVEVTRETTRRVPLPPVVGVLAIVSGIGMLVAASRR
jgi:hypothetical protein